MVCWQLAETLAKGLVLGTIPMGTLQTILDPERLSKLHDPPALQLSCAVYVDVLQRVKSKTSPLVVLEMLQSPQGAANSQVSVWKGLKHTLACHVLIIPMGN